MNMTHWNETEIIKVFFFIAYGDKTRTQEVCNLDLKNKQSIIGPF